MKWQSNYALGFAFSSSSFPSDVQSAHQHPYAITPPIKSATVLKLVEFALPLSRFLARFCDATECRVIFLKSN